MAGASGVRNILKVAWRTIEYSGPITSIAHPSSSALAISSSTPSHHVIFSKSFSAMAAASRPPSSIYHITVKDIKGNDVCLKTYRGKVLLIVNVASQCGLTTANYTDLTDLYRKYKDKGLEILAFPCNQFGGQEPGSNEQIQEFVCTAFKAEYPLFDKVEVNGDNASPLYKFLKSGKGGGLFGDSIKWNFTKFVVNKYGEVVGRFAPTTPPSKLEVDIKKYL